MKLNIFIIALYFTLGPFAFSSMTLAQETHSKNTTRKSLINVKAQTDEEITASIRAVLDEQVTAWNNGDIEGFMAGYWRSEKTVFISGDSITKGWKTVLDRYKKGYDSREKMGQLFFKDIEFNVLNKTAAIVTGYWELKRNQDNPKGRFTLFFRKVKEGWRVIHDHTSSATPKQNN